MNTANKIYIHGYYYASCMSVLSYVASTYVTSYICTS